LQPDKREFISLNTSVTLYNNRFNSSSSSDSRNESSIVIHVAGKETVKSLEYFPKAGYKYLQV